MRPGDPFGQGARAPKNGPMPQRALALEKTISTQATQGRGGVHQALHELPHTIGNLNKTKKNLN